MRAFVICRISTDDDSTKPRDELDQLLKDLLKDFLTRNDWIPYVDQDHQDVTTQRDAIFATVADGDKPLAKDTYLYTIYHEPTRTWANVNRTSMNIVTIRFRNSDGVRLKASVEKFVFECQLNGKSLSNLKRLSNSVVGKVGIKPATSILKFKFTDRIEVFEPNSQDIAYSGVVVPIFKFRQARLQRRIEFWTFIIAGIISLTFLILTIPGVIPSILSSLPNNWVSWIEGICDRIGTAAFLTSTFSFITVMLHWLGLRGKPSVTWNV